MRAARDEYMLHPVSTNEVASEYAVVFLVRNSHIVLLDSYDN